MAMDHLQFFYSLIKQRTLFFKLSFIKIVNDVNTINTKLNAFIYIFKDIILRMAEDEQRVARQKGKPLHASVIYMVGITLFIIQTFYNQ